MSNGIALVVDDSLVNRLVLVRQLEGLGLDVLQPSFLVALRKAAPDSWFEPVESEP